MFERRKKALAILDALDDRCEFDKYYEDHQRKKKIEKVYSFIFWGVIIGFVCLSIYLIYYSFSHKIYLLLLLPIFIIVFLFMTIIGAYLVNAYEMDHPY